MFVALALRSAASSAILIVYASASRARSSAFLKRAVAISSIVRVILRMFWIARRRCTRARVLAMNAYLQVQFFARKCTANHFQDVLATTPVEECSQLRQFFFV